MRRHSILIIREQGEMVVSCCVPLDGGFVHELTGTDIFTSCQEQIQSTAELYRILNRDIGHYAEIAIVDSRNFAYIFPKLVKDCITFHVPLLKALRTIFLYKIPSVIVDGILITSGENYFSKETIDYVKSLSKFPI